MPKLLQEAKEDLKSLKEDYKEPFLGREDMAKMLVDAEGEYRQWVSFLSFSCLIQMLTRSKVVGFWYMRTKRSFSRRGSFPRSPGKSTKHLKRSFGVIVHSRADWL